MLVNEVIISEVRRQVQACVFNNSDKDHYHIFFVYRGRGHLNIDGINHYVKENDYLLLHDFNNLTVRSNIYLIQIVVKIFNPEIINELSACPSDNYSNNSLFRSLVFKILSDFITKPPYYENSIKVLVMTLLILMVSDRRLDLKKRPTACDFLYVAPVDCVELNIILEYIHKHLSEDIAVSDLARSVNMTPKQINRLFKEHFNQTPMQFINNMRLSKSKELLLHSDYNITQIADMTGFKTIHYFSRFFKEKEKVSPLAYKESMRSDYYAV